MKHQEVGHVGQVQEVGDRAERLHVGSAHHARSPGACWYGPPGSLAKHTLPERGGRRYAPRTCRGEVILARLVRNHPRFFGDVLLSIATTVAGLRSSTTTDRA